MPAKGAPKRGHALLAGLFRCQRCGSTLRVHCAGSKTQSSRYICLRPEAEAPLQKCISFYGAHLEELVAAEVLRVVAPAAIQAAEQAEQLFQQQQGEKEQSLSNSLTQAEFEANRCFEQYNLVDPKNRLVAQNLEHKWNEALAKIEQLRQLLTQTRIPACTLSEQERHKLYELTHDFARVWSHPDADASIKKRIVRTLIQEIMIDLDDTKLIATIHWVGGKHTQYHIKRHRRGQRHTPLSPITEETVRRLAEVTPDLRIARILNLHQLSLE